MNCADYIFYATLAHKWFKELRIIVLINVPLVITLNVSNFSRVIEIYLSPTQGHILFLNQSMQLTQLEAPHYHEMIVHTALSYLPQVHYSLLHLFWWRAPSIAPLVF